MARASIFSFDEHAKIKLDLNRLVFPHSTFALILMAIPEKDIKKLWGLAAGRCSKPGCEEECIKFLNSYDPTVIGEMAHVIARKPDGPRGLTIGGEDTYENLILLCPTHHTEIDRAPEGIFTAEIIYGWKRRHEERVRNSFLSPHFPDAQRLAIEIKRLLVKNKITWERYGPDSEEARRNPLSNLHEIWTLRKLDTIVPNNRRIIRMIEQNEEHFNISDYRICAQFIEHAEGFERNCYVRTEGVPRFPIEFEKVIDSYARI